MIFPKHVLSVELVAMKSHDSAYYQLLQNLLAVEQMGEGLYKTLSMKERDSDKRQTYQRLAVNESEVARNIEQELFLAGTRLKKKNTLLTGTVSLIQRIVPAPVLNWLLKGILKKRMYSNLAARHRERNPGFWNLLVAHEELQHEIIMEVGRKSEAT